MTRTNTQIVGMLGRHSGRVPLVPAVTAARWVLVVFLAVAAYFFHGFLIPVLAAIVAGVAAWPLHSRLVARVGGRETLAAAIGTSVVVAFIVVPLGVAGWYAVGEAKIWIAWAAYADRVGAPAPAWIRGLPIVGEWTAGRWTETIGKPGFLGGLSQAIGGETVADAYRIVMSAGGKVLGSALNVVFFLLALFFVLKDGRTFAGQLDSLGERILPSRWGKFSRIVPSTISATVFGMGIIAIGEGVSLGTAYWIAGVPSPVLLGVATGLMALVPGGAPLIFTLVSVSLAASGSLVAGLALFAWGTMELFVVDKTLRPRLVGGPIQLPFLPTFFGLVGGVKTMGLLGIFVGPVLMALLVALWREWMVEIASSNAEADVIMASESIGAPYADDMKRAIA